MGKRNRASGQMFENWILASCAYYHDLGIAYIEKTPEPMRPLRPYGSRQTGQYVACFTKRAQPDFKGVLMDGSCVIFEAKHTDLKAHCFVLVSMGLDDFYRVPWDVWKTMKARYGRKFMTAEELEEFRVKQKGSTILFLEGVEIYEN